MKISFLLKLVTGFMILQLEAGGAFAFDRTHEIGVHAYVYAYPMVMMEVTRRLATNVEAPVAFAVSMNRFEHRRVFPDHTYKKVVCANADTLISSAWFDVSKEPMVLSVSDTGGRYYVLQLLDMWTDVFATLGSRTSGTGEGSFAIVGPGWSGTLPDGVEQLRSPTNIGWIIGRTQTNGTGDYENVHRIQDGYNLTPLSRWGTPYTPPARSPLNPTWDMKTPPPVQVANMSAEIYFELFAELLKDNPPHELDWDMVEKLKQIEIIPGEDFDFSKLSPKIQEVMGRTVIDAQKIIANKITRSAEFVNGWQIAREFMGTYGTSYLQRACIAMIGLGANLPEDAIYPMSMVDSEGIPYNGQSRYLLHFDKNQIPPVNAFWSLTMYNTDRYFVDNSINRYAIGDRDKLEFDSDGSLDIYIQHDSPGEDKESNWLPAPAGDFNLLMRLYWPRAEILTGEWNPPAVKYVN